MKIDKKQAEAISQAIMQPEIEHQKAMHQKLLASGRKRSITQFIAIFGLAGFISGGTVGYFASLPITRAAIVGLIFGVILGRIYQWTRPRQHAV